MLIIIFQLNSKFLILNSKFIIWRTFNNKLKFIPVHNMDTCYLFDSEKDSLLAVLQN